MRTLKTCNAILITTKRTALLIISVVLEIFKKIVRIATSKFLATSTGHQGIQELVRNIEHLRPTTSPKTMNLHGMKPYPTYQIRENVKRKVNPTLSSLLKDCNSKATSKIEEMPRSQSHRFGAM